MNCAHLFAGANTAEGFYSFYHYLNADCHRRVYILKGGPGTGKSTLLRSLARSLSCHYSIDNYHCSADVASLDGIYIRQLDVSLVDGTAPHSLNPRLPGAVHQLVDLGICWDTAALVRQRAKVQQLADSIAAAYKRAYRWLAAAEMTDRARWPEDSGNLPAAEADSAEIIALLPHDNDGRKQKAFASAITADGMISYLPRLTAEAANNIYLNGCHQYNNMVLHRVATYLDQKGIDAVHCYCGLRPQRLEHLYIPGGPGIWTVNRLHRLQPRGELVFGRPPAEPEVALMDRLLTRAIAELATAKELHKRLEAIYTPHVDFRQVDKIRERLLREILAL